MLNKNANNARKTLALALILTATSVALTGCGATGAESPTRNTRQVTNGVEGQTGLIKARNVLLVAQEDGSAVLVGTLLNKSVDTDSLVSIEVNGATAKIDPAQNELVKDKPVIFSGDSATAKAVFSGINATPGTRTYLTLNFANAAPLKLHVLIVEKAGHFENVG